MSATADTDPNRKVRIGILGAAAIAPSALIKPAHDLERAEVVAVAARDRGRADAFAAKHGIPVVCADYDELIAHPGIDAVYNPLPNSLHAEWTMKALAAGKHVLCEKPFAANADQARLVADVAAQSGLVVTEAFHYRYHPMMQRAVDLVQGGEIGTVRHVESWMQIPLVKRHDIRYNLDLAGGAVMDVGCYAIHQLRSLVDEEPTVTSAAAKQSSPGIDRWMRAEFAFPGGVTGRMTCSLIGAQPLRIAFRAIGEKGELRVFNPAGPQYVHRFSVRTPEGRRREKFPKIATYRYQLDAFAAAVLDGTPTLTPPSTSIANMEVIDAVYRAAGMQVRH